MRTRVLGIDASLGSTGWCVGELAGPVFTRVASGAVAQPKIENMTLDQRIGRLRANRNDMALILRDHGPFSLILLEDYAHNIGQGAHQAGEWGGVLRTLIQDRGHPLRVVNVMHVKQFATGDAHAKKDAMRLGAFKHWGFEAKTNDEVDAYVICRMGAAIVADAAGFPLSGYATSYQAGVLHVVIHGKPKPKPKKEKAAT